MTPKWIGRLQVGQELPLYLKCLLGREADVPSSHPTVEVRSESDVVHSGRVPADDQGVATGVFRGPLMLDHRFAVGRHHAIFRWLDSGSHPRVEVQEFEIIPGGSADGSLIAMQSVERPQANYLIFQTDAGRLIRGRNPR